MALHKEYNKVQRWDHIDEVAGIEIGKVYVYEKVDGANGQTFYHDSHILVGKKSCIIARWNPTKLTEDGEHVPSEIGDSFRGFPKYIFDNECYWKFFKEYKDLRLYGEWLVKHTVVYDKIFYDNFEVFDVYDDKYHRFLTWDEYKPLLDKYEIPHVPLIKVYENVSFNDLIDLVRKEELIPKSFYGADIIEGLVYKNYDFVNKYGRQTFMKAVTKDFREAKAVTIGGSRHDVEAALIRKYIQRPRLEKIYQKMLDNLDHTPTIADVPRFMGLVYYDLITEDAWEMFVRDKLMKRAKQTINFSHLKKCCEVAAKNWYRDKLQNVAIEAAEEDGT